jgi:hypothetical protein
MQGGLDWLDLMATISREFLCVANHRDGGDEWATLPLSLTAVPLRCQAIY